VSTERPNIVLLLADQLRRDALGCYGSEICKTPHLDRMAEDGVLFEQAYTPAPVCSPARASLMTGLFPHNHGVTINTHNATAPNAGLDPARPTFSAILKESGYALDYSGKWHVHNQHGPEDYGFDRHAAPHASRSVAEDSELFIQFPGGKQLAAARDTRPPEGSAIWKRTDAGLEFIRERAAGSDPFFLRIDWGAPHFACAPAEPYASMYDPAAIPPWANFEDSLEGKPSAQRRKLREWNLEGVGWGWWARFLAAYFGEISMIDACVGRVVNELENLGLAENTIVLFTCDHGDSAGSHGLFEKGMTMYEEVMHTPLLVRGPERWVRPGRFDGFTFLHDLMPTFVEWGGAEVPENLDARSLVSVLGGARPEDWRDSAYCEFGGGVWGSTAQRMCRTRRWKYVYNPYDIDELYDMEHDLGELRNLAEDPAHAEALADMKARLLGWNDATSDVFDWHWVRWNFPEPVLPRGYEERRCPKRTCF
jgi:arylsulfatase A-like enzyme